MDEVFMVPSQVPVFPHPELVLFPRAVLPLHMYEPRYRQMIADVLESDRFIATALLKPGWEPHYHTLHAPIHGVVSIGHIVAAERTEDGDYNVLLRGLVRARVLEEIEHEPYRVARVRPLKDVQEVPRAALEKSRHTLRETIEAEPIGDDEVRAYWLKLLETQLGLGDVADLIASALPVDAELRQCLLAELNPVARTSLLGDHIRTMASVMRVRRTQNPEAGWKMN
jgi:Lon protease-like protein